MVAEIVKAMDKPDDEWLVDLATDFRRWGNPLTALRLERLAKGMAGGGKAPLSAGQSKRLVPRSLRKYDE
jgi:hypothetical protein